MTTDSTREAFEKWYGSSGREWTGYGGSNPDDLHTAWQAATAHNKEKLREVRDCLWSALGADFGTARGNEWTARAYEKIYEMIGDE